MTDTAATYIDKQLEGREERKEVARVPLRGNTLDLEVIEIPIHLLSYNPNLGRIILERFGRKELRSSDLDVQQAAIQDCIRSEREFAKFKKRIQVEGQLDEGICTRDGTLINGNRRLTALRELHNEQPDGTFKHMRVAVLPTQMDTLDLYVLEVRLQMTPETRRRYGPITTLAQIRKGIKTLKLSVGEVANAMNKTEAEINQETTILGFVDEYLAFIGTPKQYKQLESGKGKYQHFKEFYELYKKHGSRKYWDAFKQHVFVLIQGGSTFAELRKMKSWTDADMAVFGAELNSEDGADAEPEDQPAPGAEGDNADGDPLIELAGDLDAIEATTDPEAQKAAEAIPAPAPPEKGKGGTSAEQSATTTAAFKSVNDKIAVMKAKKRPLDLLKRALTALDGIDFPAGSDLDAADRAVESIAKRLAAVKQKLEAAKDE